MAWRRIHTRKNDREFLTTITRDEVLSFGVLDQNRGDQTKDLIAEEMSMRVVESLEVINISDQ